MHQSKYIFNYALIHVRQTYEYRPDTIKLIP